MKRLLVLILLSTTLSGCFDSDSNNKKSQALTEGSYVVQLRSADYQSGAVVIGNIIGDRSVAQKILTKNKSDYTISTSNNYMYHIGKNGIDEISLFKSTESFDNPIWTYSANDDGDSSANPYKVIQISDTKAYVIRYGSNNLWEIDPSAKNAYDFVTKRIDLSAYNNGASTAPYMNDAVYYNGYLFVMMQRLDEDWSPSEPAYIAVIDITNNQEVDVDPQTDGLQGIKLTITNTWSSDLHNGILYVAGRGDFGSNSGGLDKIDLTTYQVTNLFNANTLAFTDLNNIVDDTYFHILDVAVVDDQTAYVQINIETGWSTDYSLIYPFNPSQQTVAAPLNISGMYQKEIAGISIDPNNRLWIGVADSEQPALVVVDTDTNTQSGDKIALELIPDADSIQFLTVQ